MIANTDALSLFTYLEVDNQADQTLFLLHGTGADENDLVPLVEPYSQTHNVVSLRGNVSEGGLLRFFKRDAHGIFDQESIQQEAEKVTLFVKAWHQVKKRSLDKATFLGFSNGANMILASVFLYPALISRAILLHPMLPFMPNNVTLKGHRFLITYGEQDPLVANDKNRELVGLLTQLEADIKTVSHPGGHEIRTTELAAITDFLNAT